MDKFVVPDILSARETLATERTRVVANEKVHYVDVPSEVVFRGVGLEAVGVSAAEQSLHVLFVDMPAVTQGLARCTLHN